MYFFIAENLGKTVQEFLAQATSSEITEWIAYFNLKFETDQASAKNTLSKMFSSRIKKAKKKGR